MRLTEALDQLSEIHAHLARGEVYRGFRAVPVAVSGLCGLGAALAQSLGGATLTPGEQVTFWVTVAALSGLIGGADVARQYLREEDAFARRRTRRVLGQFAPCLAAGAALTWAIVRRDAPPVGLLPGLWALIFGLGIFAARPYMPRSTGWVALYYLTSGTALLATADPMTTFSGWAVGGVFAAGQLASAAVLHRDVERTDNG